MKTVTRLTPLTLSSIKPRAKEYTLHDAGCEGLALRVQPSGARSWVCWHRIDDKTRRVTLGTFEALTLDDARQAFRASTVSPATTSAKTRKKLMVFAKLAALFMQAKVGTYRPSTLESYRFYLTAQILPALGKTPVDQIIPAQIASWFYDYSRTRPGGANQALGLVTTIFNWAKTEGHIPLHLPNPAAPLRRNKRRARGRLLTSKQLRSLIKVLDDASPRQLAASNAIKAILLTGCRPGEILRLTWDQITSDSLRLTQTKTGPRVVSLSVAAIDHLETLRKARQSNFVFPSTSDIQKPRRSVTATWDKLKRQAGIPDDVRLHDLRHTYASHAIMSGETLSMTGKLLGHRSPKSVERYAHLDDRFMLKAADKVSGQVEKLLGG